MPFKLEFAKADDAPEAIRAGLTEADGKFYFEGESLSEVGNLKSTLKKERDNAKKWEAENKKYEKLKPLTEAEEEEREAFLEAWAKRHEKDDGKKADPDAAKQFEMQTKLHAKELKKIADEKAKLEAEHQQAQKELREFKLWTPLRDIAIKNGMIPEHWELARLDLAEKGRFGFDEEGKVVVMEDGSPSTVSPERFFKEVYSDLRGLLYRASDAKGSGAQGGTGGKPGQKTMSRQSFEGLDQAGRMKAAKEGVQVVD